MKRGDLVTVAVSGDYGKPRPALVVQSDHLPIGDSVVVCLVTSMTVEAPLFRLPVPPGEATGLRAASQVMVYKVLTVRRARCGAVIGSVDPATMQAVSRLLALVIGIAD